MKAYVLHGVHDIRLEEKELPSPEKGEVLIRVHACGMDSLEIDQIDGKQICVFPRIPGHAFSGKVELVGAGVDSKWLHQRVSVCPLLPCYTCPSCRKGKRVLCTNVGYMGLDRNGGFAEYAVVPASNLLNIPDEMSYAEAVLLEPMAAAVHAMRKLSLVPDARVMICGMDLSGLMLLMCLQDAGIEQLYAAGYGEKQKINVAETGFPMQNYCDYGHEDLVRWIREQTGGENLDVFYECTGRNEIISKMIDIMAPMGNICLVGKSCADWNMGADVYRKIQRGHLSLMGSWYSDFTGKNEDDWHYASDQILKMKDILSRIVSSTYLMEQCMKHFQLTKQKNEYDMQIMMHVI